MSLSKQLLNKITSINESKIKPTDKNESIRLINKYIKQFLSNYKDSQSDYEDWVNTILTYKIEVRSFRGFIELSISQTFNERKYLIEELNPKVLKLGWFLTSDSIDRQSKRIIYHYAPNYGELLTEVPKIMYHTSPITYKDIILNKGLVPLSPNKNKHGFTYPPSVFLSLTKQDAIDLIPELRRGGLEFGEEAENTEYVLFSIDLSKLNKNIKFYYDPQVRDKSAVYTYTHIPSNSIKLEGKYE